MNTVVKPDIRTELPGPKARTILQRDAARMSSTYSRPYGFVAQTGKGMFVQDVDGNTFLDFMAGIAVNTTGHAHPRVVEAVSRQAGTFSHMCFSDFAHESPIALAERLNEKLGGGYRAYFGNSGTEGVEAAFKIARYHTRRPYVIAFTGAFHGRSLGSLSLTASNSRYRQGFAPLVPGVVHIPFPSPFRPPFSAPAERAGQVVLEYLDHLFKTTTPADEVAAVFVEPIQGEGGYIVPPEDFLSDLRLVTERHGILLVLDEVQSGAGRSGRFLASEYEGVQGDIVIMAKGLASGYPISAVMFKEILNSWGPGSHGTTFGGNAVSVAAAHATLDLLDEGLVRNAAQMGMRLLQGLAKLQGKYPRLGDVRGRGLMIGLDFVDEPGSHQ